MDDLLTSCMPDISSSEENVTFEIILLQKDRRMSVCLVADMLNVLKCIVHGIVTKACLKNFD